MWAARNGNKIVNATWMSFGLLVVLLAVSGCGLKPLLVNTLAIEAEQFHPPLPPAVVPVEVEVEVLTFEVTTELNDRVARGEALPYSYFAFSEQDWITFAQWQERVLLHIRQLGGLLEYYRGDGSSYGSSPSSSSEEDAAPSPVP